jgi:hypothetical protein
MPARARTKGLLIFNGRHRNPSEPNVYAGTTDIYNTVVPGSASAFTSLMPGLGAAHSELKIPAGFHSEDENYYFCQILVNSPCHF